MKSAEHRYVFEAEGIGRNGGKSFGRARNSLNMTIFELTLPLCDNCISEGHQI